MKRLFSRWNVDNIEVVRRVIVSLVGATVLLIGIALLVLPGPAFVVIPLGLAILACCLLDWCRKDFVPVGISVPAATGPEILTIVLIFGIGTLGAAIRAIAGVGLTFNHAMLPQFAGEFIVTAVALVWWQLVAYGALLSSRRNKVTGGTLPDLQ